VVNVITREGNHLFAKLGKAPRYEIFPQSDTEFFYPGAVDRVTFVKDDKGHGLKAIYRRGDYTLDAPKMEDMVEVKVDPASYDAFVGKYGLRQGQIMTVTRDGGRLFAQMSSGTTNPLPTLEIFPKSELQFFWKEVNAHVTFVKNENGTVTNAIFWQSGETTEAPRIASVNQASYDALLGKYQYNNGQTMTVTREDAHLFAQMNDQPKMEILPASETEFFWKDLDAQVTFVKDQTGKVTRSIHHQFGNTLESIKVE
jgi:hypothetical protein